HLHDQLGGVEDGVGLPEDLRAGGDVLLVSDRRPIPRGRLDDDPVATVHELADALGRRGHAVLVVLHFLRDPDDHRAASTSSRPPSMPRTSSARSSFPSTNGGDTSIAPPTRARESTPCRRASETARDAAAGSCASASASIWTAASTPVPDRISPTSGWSASG